MWVLYYQRVCGRGDDRKSLTELQSSSKRKIIIAKLMIELDKYTEKPGGWYTKLCI